MTISRLSLYLSHKLIQFSSLWLLLLAMMPSNANTNKAINHQERRDLINQLKNLKLNELIEVETLNPEAGLATRKAQKLTDTAAALFVITQEDIRRAGITSLAEALRMVPGVQVARASPNQWAISARGFNEEWASKLLVMIDGRTVYSPLRSEVNWDIQDTLIEDVERIEVIRGPGASLWGANAVNGIINIITKSAENTQGNLITTYLGKGEERAIVGIRHGGELDNGNDYRVYGKFYKHDNFVDAHGQDYDNDWQMKRGGFRIDWETSSHDILNLQGDVYDGFVKQGISNQPSTQNSIDTYQANVSGLNLLARWQRHVTNGDFILQTYYDLTQRQEFYYDEDRGIYDLDFQHRWQLNERHEFLWGLGFRYTYDDIKDSSLITFIPSKRQDNLFSAFVQSEFKIPLHFLSQNLKIDDGRKLRFILGTKLEHNDYTGFEIQPTARVLWNQNNKHVLWAAISRAVRTPSRLDEDFLLNVELPTIQLVVQGNPDLQSEELTSYEFGYRFNMTNQFLFDTAFFYNNYDKLRTNETINFKPFPPPPTSISQWGNQMDGEVYGLELATHWQVTKTWKLIGTYSYLDMQLHRKPMSNDIDTEQLENNSPHHQASLRSLWNLSPKLEFDTALYYVDNVSNQNAPHYTRFDIHLGWLPNPTLELNLGIRNTQDNQHHEFGLGSRITPLNEVPRAMYMQLKYRF